MSDDSDDEETTLFHTMDSLITDHLSSPLFTETLSLGKSKPKSQAKEEYKAAVLDLHWRVHCHYICLLGELDTPASKIQTHDLLVLCDDLKVLLASHHPQQMADDAYKRAQEEIVQLKQRLDECLMPGYPSQDEAARMISAAEKSITGKEPYKSVLNSKPKKERSGSRWKPWKKT
ncbi:uncharacterized protein DSM5745_01593 [Aspergillus mulundensis]|uniref:Uncharacterized protein n=1 Tax=Aspergillus mulundensis TaxID=1810919 RepID=A0A3D8SVK0_9EURO|nr:hypothetical protein DSM5745_01593 [Aspergillus mulundensis]RDW89818.1 hypothetical protein DSM5745_01593 [Aspergillus mulundensis]